MDKNDVSFDDWFDLLVMRLSDQGINFSDPEAVRDDYDNGKSLFDVINEIMDEYKLR